MECTQCWFRQNDEFDPEYESDSSNGLSGMNTTNDTNKGEHENKSTKTNIKCQNCVSYQMHIKELGFVLKKCYQKYQNLSLKYERCRNKKREYREKVMHLKSQSDVQNTLLENYNKQIEDLIKKNANVIRNKHAIEKQYNDTLQSNLKFQSESVKHNQNILDIKHQYTKSKHELERQYATKLENKQNLLIQLSSTSYSETSDTTPTPKGRKMRSHSFQEYTTPTPVSNNLQKIKSLKTIQTHSQRHLRSIEEMKEFDSSGGGCSDSVGVCSDDDMTDLGDPVFVKSPSCLLNDVVSTPISPLGTPGQGFASILQYSDFPETEQYDNLLSPQFRQKTIDSKYTSLAIATGNTVSYDIDENGIDTMDDDDDGDDGDDGDGVYMHGNEVAHFKKVSKEYKIKIDLLNGDLDVIGRKNETLKTEKHDLIKKIVELETKDNSNQKGLMKMGRNRSHSMGEIIRTSEKEMSHKMYTVRVQNLKLQKTVDNLEKKNRDLLGRLEQMRSRSNSGGTLSYESPREH